MDKPTGQMGEIIVYHANGELHLDVRIENETVWLTQAQMAELFASTKQNISLHIRNIFKEGELDAKVVVKNFLTTTKHGALKEKVQYHQVKNYNLDVIISVGYRIKSIQGTRFRQWANQILKDHLLKGCSINQHMTLANESINLQLINHEKFLQNLDSHAELTDKRITNLEKQMDFFIKKNTPPTEGTIPAKSWWIGYEFAVNLVRSAKEEVIIIDPFADETIFRLLAKRNHNVNTTVYTSRINRIMQEEAKLLDRQQPKVTLHNVQNVHDRFIIIDETIYHIGASIKDLGNKLTAFSVLEFLTKEQLLKMIS